MALIIRCLGRALANRVCEKGGTPFTDRLRKFLMQAALLWAAGACVGAGSTPRAEAPGPLPAADPADDPRTAPDASDPRATHPPSHPPPAGATPAADKSRYHLFRPTPRALMREMSTDRPDKTESAYTVDAGHVQVEADVVAYGRDWRAGRGERDSERWAVANTNFKLGLANDLDVQLVLPLYERTRLGPGDGGGDAVSEGFGDTAVRLKWNLWGNDAGPTALAVMPFVTFPTAADRMGTDGVEGGVIVPFATELPAGWGLGMMTQLERARDGGDGGYRFEWTNSATAGHAIFGRAGGYAEVFGSVDTERPGEWEGTVDFGLTYSVSGDVQLDAGVNVGVTESAEDFVFFVGVSWRG